MTDLEDINECHATLHDAAGLTVALQMALWELCGESNPPEMEKLNRLRVALVALGSSLEATLADALAFNMPKEEKQTGDT